MNPNSALGQSLDGCTHVHCVSAESIKLRHDQHIAFFHPAEQIRESRSLFGAHASRDTFRYDPTFVDREAS